MRTLERFERARRIALVGIFVGSALLFSSFLVRINFSWWHIHRSFPHENAFLIGDLALLVAMLAIAVWRRLASMKAADGDPALRKALKDERVKFAWLKAYRLAFFALLTIQVMSKGPIMIWHWPWDVPYQSALTLSAAIAVSVGAFLFYDRETGHE